MGITVEQWRAVIGCFSQPVRVKCKIQTLRLRYNACMSLSIGLLLFALLVVEGIEANPGPGPRGGGAESGTERGYRGRGSGRGYNGAARGYGPPRGRGARNVDHFADYTGRHDARSLRRSQRIQGQTTANRPSLSQSSLSAWLMSSQQTQEPDITGNTDPPSETQSEVESQPDRTEEYENTHNMTDLLVEIRNDVKSMDKKFDKLDKKVQELKKDNKQLKQQNIKLSKQVTELTTSVINLETRLNETEKKNEHLEAQHRRDKFFGITPDDQKETWEESENKVRYYLSNELMIDDRDIKFERAHRLPSKSSKSSPRPIIVKFSHFKDRETVLKKYRKERRGDAQPGQNDDQNAEQVIRVSEDFPIRVTKARKKLYPFMRSCQ